MATFRDNKQTLYGACYRMLLQLPIHGKTVTE